MSHYSCLLSYIFIFDNVYLETAYFFLNIGFYSMEIKHKLMGQLKMNLGEISIVEIELFFSIVFLLSGLYGHGVLQQTFGAYFTISSDSYFTMLADFRLAEITGFFILLL